MACRFFQSQQGCFRGDSCTFRHDDSSNASNSATYGHDDPLDASTSLASGIENVRISVSNPYANGGNSRGGAHNSVGGGMRHCRFYAAGSCRNGPQCPFAHIDSNNGAGSYPMYYAPPLPPAMPPMMLTDPPPPLPPPPHSPATGYSQSMGSSHQNPSPRNSNDRAMHTSNSSNSAGGPTATRRLLKIQANPSKTANYEVISEVLPVLTREIEGPFFAIDVECVATGTGTEDRDVARIAVVDEDENVVFDAYVKPTKPIVSYLTQLTGITESNLVDAPTLHDALVQLKALLPADSVIVGQSIKKDLEWLMLERAVDYKQMFDVADLFRIPMQSLNGTIRYRYFSLRHVAKYLLGHNIQEADHDPVIDAKYAMKIFKQFRYLHESPGHRDAVYQTLLKTPRTPSFADRYPMIDGVAMRAPRKASNHPFAKEQGAATTGGSSSSIAQ